MFTTERVKTKTGYLETALFLFFVRGFMLFFPIFFFRSKLCATSFFLKTNPCIMLSKALELYSCFCRLKLQQKQKTIGYFEINCSYCTPSNYIQFSLICVCTILLQSLTLQGTHALCPMIAHWLTVSFIKYANHKLSVCIWTLN